MLNMATSLTRTGSGLAALGFAFVVAVSVWAGTARAAGPAMPAEIVFPSAIGEVRFPHRAHLKKKCVRCHHSIHADSLETPHDSYLDSSWIHCQTCHDSNPERSGKYYKCSECHHAAPENIADETLSSKVVIHKSCWQCHEAGTGAQASQACNQCHIKAADTSAHSPEPPANDQSSALN